MIIIRDTGGTDHLSYDAVGIPGFQFIQDPHGIRSKTHHSNMDVLDHMHRSDMMQMSAIVASFVYNTAMRPQMCLASRCLRRNRRLGRVVEGRRRRKESVAAPDRQCRHRS